MNSMDKLSLDLVNGLRIGMRQRVGISDQVGHLYHNVILRARGLEKPRGSHHNQDTRDIIHFWHNSLCHLDVEYLRPGDLVEADCLFLFYGVNESKWRLLYEIHQRLKPFLYFLQFLWISVKHVSFHNSRYLIPCYL